MTHISRLTLTAFRNYGHLRLTARANPIVLTGPNGAGKTNLLEAISLLGPGRGLRNAKLAEVAQAGVTSPWGVAAVVESESGSRDVGTGSEESVDRRTVRIDGANRTQGALAEVATILWLTPAMDRIFTEPSSVRRRFVDRIVYGYDPAHATRVNRYDQAQRERQKLLEENRHPAWLDGIESVLVETGVAVAGARVRVVEKLNRACAENEAGPFPSPVLQVQGDLESWLEDAPALAVEDRYRAALARNRGLDAAAGRSAIGAHRSDLAAIYREKNMPAALCSTGEQKALLVALLLANAGLMLAERGQKPILILDEIAAHLDETRRIALFERIAGLRLQAWMSGTDRRDFAPLGEQATYLSVGEGQVTSHPD